MNPNTSPHRSSRTPNIVPSTLPLMFNLYPPWHPLTSTTITLFKLHVMLGSGLWPHPLIAMTERILTELEKIHAAQPCFENINCVKDDKAMKRFTELRAVATLVGKHQDL
ncbi:hypothetical protein JHK82_044656 [Glycine max]|nr:hypothetical protein JHK87_044847 [Glycine soja]KAG5099604.1 hypothetical protein JHK82_044656 [Glycine max]KAG5108205.1 hypothetical protein JHK84_045112 [Glycine max]